MKKRIISLVLVIALMSAMCLSASAVSTTGLTEGGSNSYQVIATLNASKTFATATTSTDCTKTYIHNTSVTYTYYNSNNQISYASANGNKSATVYPNVPNGTSGICADSQHQVNGGTIDGNWSSNLHVGV